MLTLEVVVVSTLSIDNFLLLEITLLLLLCTSGRLDMLFILYYYYYRERRCDDREMMIQTTAMIDNKLIAMTMDLWRSDFVIFYDDSMRVRHGNCAFI